jgi:dTDP-4-dehydrorhamnose reductase
MRVLITGAKGQLGCDIVRFLVTHGIECYGVSKEEFDLCDMDYTAKFISDYLPNVVIHCAAYTDVDLAERNIEQCRILNVDVTDNIAKICKRINCKLVYISTDYIFSGEEKIPYEIYSEAKPQSIYGQTKLDGEKAVLKSVDKHFIIRTSWIFGGVGENFVNTMLRISKQKETINVVSDQIGSPTYTEDLARLIADMIQTDKYGIYHATNEGYCNWAEFASRIFEQAGCNTKVNFINSDQYPTKAVRPKNSRLSKKSLDAAGFKRLPSWQEALTKYFAKIDLSSK